MKQEKPLKRENQHLEEKQRRETIAKLNEWRAKGDDYLRKKQEKEEQFAKKWHKLIYSLLIGGIGGIIASFFTLVIIGITEYGNEWVLLSALVVGFIICFLISLVYLKAMKDKTHFYRILFGGIFGLLVGGILSFLIWHIDTYIMEKHFDAFMSEDLIWFVIVGSIIGAIIGVNITREFGKKYLDRLTGTEK